MCWCSQGVLCPAQSFPRQHHFVGQVTAAERLVGTGHKHDSTFGSLGQPLDDAVSPSSCVGGRGSCTAKAGCPGWSLPSWSLFHPRNPPLCLPLHSASGAWWKLAKAGLCLCPLLCWASRVISMVSRGQPGVEHCQGKVLQAIRAAGGDLGDGLTLG